MSIALYPNLGALLLGGILQTELALCKLKLTKSLIVPAKTVLKASLTAVECDFSGYAAKTVTALLAPYVDGDGISIMIPTTQWDFDGSDMTPTANTVYNWWLELAAGDLIIAGQFLTPIGMAAGGDSIPFEGKLSYFATDEIEITVGGSPA